MPVPWVLATRLGCTQRISSVGVKPDGQERVDGGDDVPQRHPVDRAGHVLADAPHRRVEPGRDLRADGPRQLGLARHANLGARLAGNLPVAASREPAATTVCSGSNSTNARGRRPPTTRRSVKSLSRNTLHQQRRCVIGVDRAVVDELADAARARPRRRGSARPARPRRPAHRMRCRTSPACGSSSHLISPVVQASSSTPAADSSLSTSISKRVRDEPYGPSSAPPTMTTRSAGSTSRSAHAGGGGRREAARRRRQRGDGARGRRRRRMAGLAAWPPRGPWRPVRPCRARRRRARRSGRPCSGARGRGHLGLDVAQAEQHRRHLLRGVGGHAGLFDRARRSRRCGPSARCPGSSRSARGPRLTRCAQDDSAFHRVDHRVQRRLGLAVGAVAAEHAAVRASRAAPRAAARRCRARRRSPTARRSAAARPTAAPSSPSPSASRPPTGRRPPAAPRTGTAASGSARP